MWRAQPVTPIFYVKYHKERYVPDFSFVDH